MRSFEGSLIFLACKINRLLKVSALSFRVLQVRSTHIRILSNQILKYINMIINERIIMDKFSKIDQYNTAAQDTRTA